MNTGMVIGVSLFAVICIVVVVAMALGYKITNTFTIAKQYPPKDRAAAKAEVTGIADRRSAGAA